MSDALSAKVALLPPDIVSASRKLSSRRSPSTGLSLSVQAMAWAFGYRKSFADETKGV